MPVVLGAKPPLKTVLNSNPLGKIAINRAETKRPTSSSHATSCVSTQAIKAWQKTKEKPAQRDKHMLHDVSARFEAGSLTLVLGPPQSGKSCLLRCIAGLLRPAGKSSLKAEEISFNGDPVYPAITGGETQRKSNLTARRRASSQEMSEESLGAHRREALRADARRGLHGRDR